MEQFEELIEKLKPIYANQIDYYYVEKFAISVLKLLIYRGSFRFRFALFTRAQGVPFLHTTERTSNRCRFSVLSLWGDPYPPMTQ